jgi:hypothetical protein
MIQKEDFKISNYIIIPIKNMVLASSARPALFFTLDLAFPDDLAVLDVVDVCAVGVDTVVLDRIRLIPIVGIRSKSLFHCYHRLFL